MSTVKTKKYAQITSYGKLVVPLEILPKILESCYLVETTWEDSKYVISKINQITEVTIKDSEEITAALIQMKLSGE